MKEKVLATYGFTEDDLSVLDVPPELHPECYAYPASENTFCVQSSKRDGEYTVRYNGEVVYGDNCLSGIHERDCWHQKRTTYHLKRRAARLDAQKKVTQPALIEETPKRDLAPLHSAVRPFSLMRR